MDCEWEIVQRFAFYLNLGNSVIVCDHHAFRIPSGVVSQIQYNIGSPKRFNYNFVYLLFLSIFQIVVKKVLDRSIRLTKSPMEDLSLYGPNGKNQFPQ